MTATDLAGDLTAVCSALGDPTRWEILSRLGEEAMSASALARVLPVSRQAIAKHLDLLTDVGLITNERRGREVVHLVIGAKLNALGHELERLGNAWDARLRAIKELAEESADS